MILAAGDRVMLYASANLKEWSFASEFGRLEGSHEGMWECPDIFELSVDTKRPKEGFDRPVSIFVENDGSLIVSAQGRKLF